MHALDLYHVLSTVQQIGVNWALSIKKKNTMMLFSPLEIWKEQPLLLGIHARGSSSNPKISELLGFSLATDSYSYWCKPNTQSIPWCLSGHEQWWCYASIHLLTCPHKQYIRLRQIPGGDSVAIDWEAGCWKTLHLATGLCTIPHKQENPALAGRKFLQPP